MPHPIAARMALEILWRELEFEHDPHTPLEPEKEAVAKALDAMHAMLWRKEMEAVAATALSAHYLIIRPGKCFTITAWQSAQDAQPGQRPACKRSPTGQGGRPRSVLAVPTTPGCRRPAGG